MCGPGLSALVLGDGPAPTDRAWAPPVAAVLIGVAVLVWPGHGWSSGGRWPGRGKRRAGVTPGRPGSRVPFRARRGLFAAAGTLAVGVLVGAPGWPLAAAVVVAWAAGRWLPEGASAAPGRQSPGIGVASAAGLLDLLATAVEAGLPLSQAISAVAELDESRLAGILREVGQLLALGVPPAQAWRPATDDQDLAPVAAAAVRSAIGGLTVADAAREAAREIRDRARAASDRAAARAEVTMTAPLALCFLPAFLCLGLAPVIIGLVTGLHLF